MPKSTAFEAVQCSWRLALPGPRQQAGREGPVEAPAPALCYILNRIPARNTRPTPS